MTYTQQQIQLFNDMFFIHVDTHSSCHITLKDNNLFETNYVYNPKVSYSICIYLSNGKVYKDRYGFYVDLQAITKEIFDRFIEMNYNENQLEMFLKTETGFMDEEEYDVYLRTTKYI